MESFVVIAAFCLIVLIVLAAGLVAYWLHRK